MDDLTDLRRRFAIPGAVTIEPGANGLPRVAVATPLADAHVYLHGAHVTHYQPRGRPPVLFMSGRSHFAPGKPIRGGVPLIFPWFGPSSVDPKLPAHGFARTQPWTLAGVRQGGDGAVAVTLSLAPNEATRALWPHAFALTYTVTVGAALGLALEVHNTGDAPFTFEEALHTYLAVADVRDTSTEGLAGRAYLDKVDGGRRKTQGSDSIRITGETDRVYLDTPDTVTVFDPGKSEADERAIVVSKANSLATVVWNPWVAKSKAMADFGDDEWPGMLCVETANAAQHAVTLAPGARHAMRAEIRG